MDCVVVLDGVRDRRRVEPMHASHGTVPNRQSRKLLFCPEKSKNSIGLLQTRPLDLIFNDRPSNSTPPCWSRQLGHLASSRSPLHTLNLICIRYAAYACHRSVMQNRSNYLTEKKKKTSEAKRSEKSHSPNGTFRWSGWSSPWSVPISAVADWRSEKLFAQTRQTATWLRLRLAAR